MLGESESDLSRENVDHFGSHGQKIIVSIYNVSSSSGFDSNDDREVFMVGQNDVPGDQIEEEITQATTVKIVGSR
jgi:hypothetical protein